MNEVGVMKWTSCLFSTFNFRFTLALDSDPKYIYGAINYKSDDIAARLAELAPAGIDIYFENTGGPIQQHVFDRMNAHGRIVVCGMIADYGKKYPVRVPTGFPSSKSASPSTVLPCRIILARCRSYWVN